MKETKNEMREWWERVVRVLVVGVMLFSAGVQAGYKPPDISNIPSERRKELQKAARAIEGFPAHSRDAFLCERLGLFFRKDYALAALSKNTIHPYTSADSCCVSKNGRTVTIEKGFDSYRDEWCRQADQWDPAVFHYMARDVERLALGTAKYLLKNMLKEHRWMILALMGEVAYNDRGLFDRGRVDWWMESGFNTRTPHDEGRDYFFLGPDGKEYDIRALITAHPEDWRWRQMVWRCENLVGSKDILALFSEEVEAMREQYKRRLARLEDEEKAKNNALMVAADEGMSSLPKEKRLARIALAVGLYYLDHKEAGCADGHLNPKATIILPDGTKHSGQEFIGEAPELLQQVPHEAILEYYRQTIGQMARKIAEARFKELPPPLRDLLRAKLSRKLIKLNGSPAKINESTCAVQTFNRTWQVPVDAPVDREHTYFRNSSKQKLPYSIYDAYEEGYEQTLRLVYLCAQILGKEETAELIPPGGGTD